MLKLTLPKYERIYGTKKSKVFDIIGGKARISDVAIGMGGLITKHDDHVEGDNSLKGRTGDYLTGDKDDKYDDSYARSVNHNGNESRIHVSSRIYGVRPALQFLSIDELTRIVSGELEDLGDGIKKGKVYVPLYLEKEKQGKLQNLLMTGKIKQLAPNRVIFPTDSNGHNAMSNPFEQKNNNYYEHEGELYLLLEVNSAYDGKPIQFSNGEYYKDGDSIFIKVEETDLYVDEEIKENGYYEAYFDTILFAGVPISHTMQYPHDFDVSDMGQYLKVYLQELEKLQQVVREIKGKSQSNLEANPENNVIATTDSAMEAQKLAQYFLELCNRSASLDAQINALKEQLANAEKDKNATDERIGQFRRLMYHGGTEDGR